MGLRALLFVYLLGGLTFIPLVLIALIAAFWYTLPFRDSREGPLNGVEKETEEAAAVRAQYNGRSPTDGAASATFAVLRRYDFQGATAAFKEAEAATRQAENAADGKTAEGSISVYQSMYRSVFDRNKNAANPMREEEAAQQEENASTAKARGKVFYIVLRHGHLMLYDSAVQFEVRHVISLAHYRISLQDDIADNADLLDAELFAKRVAIVLTSTMTEESISSSSRKPFYLFCNVNIEKEDFYHALLSSTNHPPIPRAIDPELAIKLQSALHSTSLTLEDRALNALLGRVFLGLHRTPFLESFVRTKIEKKMARIAKPSFIASIACHSLDLGDAAPVISNLRLKEFNITGETVLSLDLKYAGNLNLTIAAVAKLDLGPRFKTRMVTLLLAVVLQRIQGKMLVKIKPPPSGRIWITFETMPEMELKIEPVVSSRQIKYAFVLRAIEARIREAFAEGLVHPNWDDSPFFTTSAQQYRGGIWESEGQQVAEEETTGALAATSADPLSLRNGKTMSTPTLANDSALTGAESLITEGLKHRSTASSFTSITSDSALSAADKAWSSAPSARPPKSVRSPSLATSKPLVAVDDYSAEPVRSDDPTALPNRRRWIGRTPQAQTPKRNAAEVVRQVRDRDISRSLPDDHDELADVETDEPLADDYGRSSEPGAEGVHISKSPRSMIGFGSVGTGPELSGRRDEVHSRNGSQDGFTQRKTILATTAAATNAAKNWTWNAVANRANRQQPWTRGPQRQGSRASNESEISLPAPPVAEPVGRGQPLPPPGMPLPGPQKGLWSAAATSLGGIRKKAPPRLPARRPQSDNLSSTPSQTSIEEPEVAPDDDSMPLEKEVEAEGEFGPWMANHDEPAPEEAEVSSSQPQIVVTPDELLREPIKPKKKPPPPLPPRRMEHEEQTIVSADPSLPSHGLTNSATSENGLSADLTEHQLAPVHTTEEHDIQSSHKSSHTFNHEHDTVQSPTPPDLIELDDEHEAEEATTHHDLEHDLEEPLTEADLAALDDDVQAIPAPVDEEAEHNGVLELAEHSELPPGEDEELEVVTSPKAAAPTQLQHLDEHLLD